ncbi:hypothetical protein [Ferruginibacter albus]|uniref:hypothetical protein n=1 Tax=Ferruginibacter albus TaxID=2875540 RepID=UPI001CC5D0F6|nr:hypothetical protein [Ferruginibacter albus]UAY52502.1 hypothetical protein K9M53_02140 [Ferruginibacter albus]
MSTIRSIPFFIFFLLPLTILAQNDLTSFAKKKQKPRSITTIATGIGIDINSDNQNYTFTYIPITVTWVKASYENIAFIAKAELGIPFGASGSDSAYTLNPSLPSSISLKKKIAPYLFSLGIGLRINVLENKKKQHLLVDFLPLEIFSQNFNVSYSNYDKSNYDIINPDVDLNRTSLAIGLDIAWQTTVFKKNVFVTLGVQTPVFTGTGDYELSYKLITPLQLTFGYGF